MYKQVYSSNDLLRLFYLVDDLFCPKLSATINLVEYSKKIIKNGYCICYAPNNDIQSFLCYYINEKEIYITFLSTIPPYFSKGGATKLLSKLIGVSKKKHINIIHLECRKNNTYAYEFYSKRGFRKIEENNNKYLLELVIKDE